MARYVNVGCGFSTGSSWENYDASPTLRFERLPLIGRLYTKNRTRFPADARFGDITRGPLGPPGSADAVFCSHMLEHVARDDMRRALGHIFTMLRPGGTFRLIVPDLAPRARAYCARGDDPEAADAFMENAGLGAKRSHGGLVGRLKWAFGNSAHLWMYDEASLRAELARAGFTGIRRCRLGDSAIAAFAEVEERGRFESEDGPELAMACEKPDGA